MVAKHTPNSTLASQTGVYGLLQINRFSRALEKVTENIPETLENVVEITPFKNRKDPLIFPFLITEAKTERGDSFEASECQAAFPI